MTMLNVFDFDSFHAFLAQVTLSKGKRGGMKSSLARAMGSHPAFLSRVLSGQARLSLEQAEKMAAHLLLRADEKRYMLFLLEEERAGTASLKGFFREERTRLKRSQQEIKNRIPPSEQISLEQQAVYYSSWHYAAIHVLVSVPGFQDVEAIAAQLQIPQVAVKEAMHFLEEIGVLARKGNKWTVGERHLHVDKKSPFVRQHHQNWRLKSIQALAAAKESDLRYSGAFSLSREDAGRLREVMLAHLNEVLETAAASAEEVGYVFNLDFFEL